MVAGYERAYSLTSLQKPFLKNGKIFIELEVMNWDAGSFEPLVDDLNNHGVLAHMRFEEAKPAVLEPEEQEVGDPEVEVPSPS